MANAVTPEHNKWSVPTPTTTPGRGNCVSVQGLSHGSKSRNLHYLNRLHSKHITWFAPISTEETSLEFHPNFIVATVTRQFGCFLPKKRSVQIIPRSSVKSLSFTLGPRSIPKITYLIITASLLLIFSGAVLGGCHECKADDGVDVFGYQLNYCFVAACPFLVAGILMLMIPVPLLASYPLLSNW